MELLEEDVVAPASVPRVPAAPPSRPALTLAGKVGIALAVVVVVGAVVGFLVYWFVFHNRTTPGGQGTNKFGTITVTDTSSHIQTGTFAPGDTLEVRYAPTAVGFGGRGVFSFSSDGGQTFPTTLTDPTFANAVTWVVPATVFTNQAVFRVHDVANPNDYVQTTTPLSIQPPFALTSGPGLTRDSDVVFANQLVTVTLQTDTTLKGLTATGFAVRLSADAQFLTGVVSASLQPAVIDTATNTVRLSWTVFQSLRQVYYRVATTQLVAAGEPYELTATSPRTIQVAINDSCEGKTDDGSSFVLCQLTMVQTSSGVSGTFPPGVGVTLYVAYRHTYPGTAAFSYTVNGGAAVPWSTTFNHQTDTLLVFTATLPDLIAAQFQVTVVAGDQTQHSDAYHIVPTLQFQLPVTPRPTFNVTQYHSAVTNFTVAVTLDPPNYRPAVWQMGYQQVDGSGTVLWPEANITNITYTGNTATVVWVMAWSDFGASTPQGQLTRQLVLAANTDQAVAASTVVFDLVNYAPSLYPLLQANLPSYPLCGSTPLPAGQAVNTLCVSGETSLAGLWPDPAGSNAVYILVNDANIAHTVIWWADVQQNQNITAQGPQAPNPVNYVNAVVLPGPVITAPPAGAALFRLSAGGEGSQLLFTPVAAPTQTLYVDGFSTALRGLYALNSGVVPDERSQFLWPHQRLPPLT